MADNSLFENTANTSSENQIPESTNEKNKSEGTDNIKLLDNEKDIVYKASNEPYPVININSKEVKDINAEIQETYKEFDNNPHGLKLEYNYYLNNEILSLLITTPIHTGGYNYNVYNINTNTGKSVSNTDLLKSKNIDETDFMNKLSEIYKNKFLELNR